jgi:hypothetical protein
MNDILIFGAFLFFYLLLMWKAGKVFPILYLFFLIYFLQYVFSTYLIYNVYDELRHQMPIKQTEYFYYCIPALVFLFAGMLMFNKDIDVRYWLKRIDPRQATNLGYLLFAVSYGLDIMSLLGVTSLASILSFTSYFKYVAAICFLFTRSRLHLILIGIIYAQLALSVLRGGVFIDFFVWSTFLFLFICFKYQMPYWVRASFIFVVVPLIILVQSVKYEYREQTWSGKKETGVQAFTEIARQKNLESANVPFLQSEGVIRTVGRLTQGWHLGLTMRRVPARQSWVDGDEMWSDVVSSILPRALYPDKKEVNSPEKFYKYTGHRIYNGTSMSIGILGDFYINFHEWGSFVMLFFFGALVAKLLYFFMKKYVYPNPINIVWVPFMLSYLIRANNDFYMVFNCMLKGFVMFLFINYISKKLWTQRPITQLQ